MKEMELQFLLLMICNAHVWTSQGRGEICGRTPPFPLRAPAHLPTTLPRTQNATDRDSQPPGVENEEFRWTCRHEGTSKIKLELRYPFLPWLWGKHGEERRDGAGAGTSRAPGEEAGAGLPPGPTPAPGTQGGKSGGRGPAPLPPGGPSGVGDGDGRTPGPDPRARSRGRTPRPRADRPCLAGPRAGSRRAPPASPRRQHRMRGRRGKRGSGRAPDSNRCSGGRGENWGKETARGEWNGAEEGGGESGRGVWKGSVEDSKGTRQKPGEEAGRPAGAGRGVRGRTGRLWAPTAAARGTRPGSLPPPRSARPPSLPTAAPWWTGAPCWPRPSSSTCPSGRRSLRCWRSPTGARLPTTISGRRRSCSSSSRAWARRGWTGSCRYSGAAGAGAGAGAGGGSGRGRSSRCWCWCWCCRAPWSGKPRAEEPAGTRHNPTVSVRSQSPVPKNCPSSGSAGKPLNRS